MAIDDYDFLVFRILTYLYACFRRRCHFETTAFMKRVISPEVSEDYLVDVLRFMTRENRGEYLDALCKKCKERIDKLGITRDNAGEISKHAADMYLGERYDEVEAEFMSLRRRT